MTIAPARWASGCATAARWRISTSHHLTGCTRRYADAYALPGAPGWWGKGEPLFVSATPRKGKTGSAGVIRRVSFDHLYLTSESCAFAAGEPDSEIRDLRISEMHLILQRRGTQPGGLFDEQPSARHIYPHAIPGAVRPLCGRADRY